MVNLPVADYFQEDSEDALRSRIQWLEAEVNLDDGFFAALLRTDEGAFRRWKEQQGGLPDSGMLALRAAWEMMMHLLSFVNFDTDRARRLLEHVAPATAGRPGPGQAPPWLGSSMKAYLQIHGAGAVDDVMRWVTSFRFGPPSRTPEQELPCPSSQG
jgi:hypothetical protein